MRCSKNCTEGVQTGISGREVVCPHCAGSGVEPEERERERNPQTGWETQLKEEAENQTVYWPVLYHEHIPIRILTEEPIPYGNELDQFTKFYRILIYKIQGEIRWISRKKKDGVPPLDSPTVIAW